jgi:hypothetical protein
LLEAAVNDSVVASAYFAPTFLLIQNEMKNIKTK